MSVKNLTSDRLSHRKTASPSGRGAPGYAPAAGTHVPPVQPLFGYRPPVYDLGGMEEFALTGYNR